MSAQTQRKKKVLKSQQQKEMVFGPQNYLLLAIAVLLLVIGYTGTYLENEFKGFFSLYVAPILIMSGFILVVFGILRKPAPASDQESRN